jgi:hypothetical protein
LYPGSTSVENLVLNLPDFFLNLQKRKNAKRKTQKRKNAKTQKSKMQKCENAKNAKRKGKNPKLNMTFINKIVIYNISGLYYKHVKIINDNSSVFIK